MNRRGHKYGAKPMTVDGIRFASQKEARRYGELKLLQRAGEIHGLELQPAYWLMAEGETLKPIGTYRADFKYCQCRRGKKCDETRVVVEDVKGFKTPLYRWKKKHVEAQYGITISEV